MQNSSLHVFDRSASRCCPNLGPIRLACVVNAAPRKQHWFYRTTNRLGLQKSTSSILFYGPKPECSGAVQRAISRLARLP